MKVLDIALLAGVVVTTGAGVATSVQGDAPNRVIEALPFLNTVVLLGYLWWSGRKLWDVSHRLAEMPGDINKKISEAMSKVASTAGTTIGGIQDEMDRRMGGVEEDIKGVHKRIDRFLEHKGG